MEDEPIPTTQTTDPITPITQGSVVTEQPAAPFTPVMPANTTAKKPLPLIPILGGIILLLLIAVLVLFLQNRRTNAPTEQLVSTPTIAPTPTPIRKPSALSLTDAFSSFSAQKASFSAEINNFTFQEGLFTPPTLDLDLLINE